MKQTNQIREANFICSICNEKQDIIYLVRSLGICYDCHKAVDPRIKAIQKIERDIRGLEAQKRELVFRVQQEAHLSPQVEVKN